MNEPARQLDVRGDTPSRAAGASAAPTAGYVQGGADLLGAPGVVGMGVGGGMSGDVASVELAQDLLGAALQPGVDDDVADRVAVDATARRERQMPQSGAISCMAKHL